MPGRDGTGPLGQGPRTGRGFGGRYCGRGYRNFANRFGFGPNQVANLSPQEEASLLKEDAKAIEEELKRINQRIDELEKNQNK